MEFFLNDFQSKYRLLLQTAILNWHFNGETVFCEVRTEYFNHCLLCEYTRVILLYCIVFNCELCITQRVNCMYILTLLQTILTKDWQMTDPTSRQRGCPKLDRTVTFKGKKNISGQKSQIGLDTKTYWLTDCQLQCNADADAKAIPVTGRGGPYDCKTSRLPHYLHIRFADGGEVVSLTRRPPFTSRKIPGTHFS
jgi:hypothetical protein